MTHPFIEYREALTIEEKVRFQREKLIEMGLEEVYQYLENFSYMQDLEAELYDAEDTIADLNVEKSELELKIEHLENEIEKWKPSAN